MAKKTSKKPLNEIDAAVLDAVKRAGPGARRSDIDAAVKQLTASQVTGALQRLRGAGKITMTGEKRAARYHG